MNEIAIWSQDGEPWKFTLAADKLLPNGKRAILRNERATNATDPGRIRTVQWEYATPVGFSRESVGGVLGCDYAQNLDTRFPRRLLSAGARNAVTLTTKDPSGVSGTYKLGEFKLGAQKLGANVSASDNVTHFDEQGGRMFAHRGRLSTQVLISNWSVEATHIHPESVQGATSWFGKGRVGLGAAANMRTREAISTSGSIYESTRTILGEDVYAGPIAVGSDRCWYVTKGSTGELENLVGYTLDDFDTIANPFQVGDPRVKANGIGPFGPFTFFGTRTNIYSFTDQAKKVPLSRALIGHNSVNNGKQWADPGWGWNYYISDIGLRACTSHIDNPVGIGEAMRQFTGHNGRPTAIWAERGELFVVYEDSAGNAWAYRCTFGPQTSAGGQPDMYPWWYKASTSCNAVFSTNTPTNTAVAWAEGTNMAYETISRDGRDDMFTSRTYGILGGSWFGTTLDRDPHLLKVLRLARVRTKGLTSGSTWHLLWSFDDGSYVSAGTVTSNGYVTIYPVQETQEVPLDDISGRTMKPKLVQVALGTGASTTSPELSGVLEVEYDERPEYITEVACTVVLDGNTVSKDGIEARLNSLKGSSTTGPVRIQLPDQQGRAYGMVANVQNRRDIQEDVEAVDVIIHLWATS